MSARSATLKELRQKSEAELQKLLEEGRRAVHQASFQAASKQLKDMSAVRKAKRAVARILTVLRAKRI